MKVTIPGVELKDLMKRGCGLIAVMLIDSAGNVTCSDGYVPAAVMDLPAGEFVQQVGVPCLAQCLEEFRASAAKQVSVALVTH